MLEMTVNIYAEYSTPNVTSPTCKVMCITDFPKSESHTDSLGNWSLHIANRRMCYWMPNVNIYQLCVTINTLAR